MGRVNLAQPSSPSEPRSDFEPGLLRRIALTTSCTDADVLPRVPNAGAIENRNNQSVQIMHNGVLVEAGGYFGDWMAHIIQTLRGVHEPQEEVAFHAVMQRLRATAPVDRVPQIIEVGSFWAYYSLWFLHEFPEGRALCLEPDPVYMEVGRRNFALNAREGEFVHGAIGSDVTTSLDFVAESTGQRVSVPTFDLPSLLERTADGHADLILIDAQGAEIDALRSGVEAFARGQVRFLVVSTHDLAISGSAVTHQTALGLLRDAGAHIIAEHTVSESFSGDGLIVASFDDRDTDMSVELSYARSVDSLFGEWEPRCEEFRLATLAQAAETEALHQRVRELEARVADLENSTSWKITRPLRALKGGR